MKPLIIVESPTKAKTISKFLAGKYDVKASFGHIRDLPKTKLGVDVDNDFDVTYTIPVKAKEHIKELKQYIEKTSHIILATDEDREGEAIAWHLTKALDIEKWSKKHKKPLVERIVFHEITKTAIDHALKTPRTIDDKLVDAQQARRVLDRLVGYNLSPFLWHKVRYGLSAGRVQSVALRLIVEREKEIKAFIAQEYWSVEGLFFGASKKDFISKLVSFENKNLTKFDINNQERAGEIVSKIKNLSYNIASIETKEVRKNPSPPFTTSTLQQEASKKLGFSAKQTMAVAQGLYEGLDMGEYGQVGLITYMRTDSVFIAKSALEQIKYTITKEFGDQYTLSDPRYFKSGKAAQEAHEAIRPANIEITPEYASKFLDRNQLRLYTLIWKRTMACQMAQALFSSTAVQIKSTDDSATFKANGQTLIFDGFIKAYTDETDEEDSNTLPKLNEGESVTLKEITPKQHFTESPSRYTDASLIKELEASGVGRPSTYAPTLSTIQDRGYVEKIEKKYLPTEIGFLVCDLLVDNFPEIIDVGFTAKVENDFDEIAEGKNRWQDVIKGFYTPFKKNLDEKETSVEKKQESSNHPCPHCGNMMLIKFGRNGKFLACPEKDSKVTLPSPEEQADIKALQEKTKDEKCLLCSKPMNVKKGRFGYFLGCSDYPNCKGIAKIVTRIGFKCPLCATGDLIERKSRGRGKSFYGCMRYPDCNFLTNTKPTSEEDLVKALEEFKNKKPSDKKKSTSKKSFPRKKPSK